MSTGCRHAMERALEQAHQCAVDIPNLGKLKEAKALHHEVLEIQPIHYDATHRINPVVSYSD